MIAMRDVGVELSPVVRSQRGDELGTSISTRENVPTLVPSKVLVDPDDDGLSPDTPQAAEIMYRIAQLETAVRGLQAASMPQEAPAERVEKLENFYSYCVEELVFSKSSARRLKFSLLIILVACAQWCAGKFRISDLTRMPRGASLVFAVHPIPELRGSTPVRSFTGFGFYDAAWLSVYQGHTNLLGGPLSEASFYADNSIADEESGNALPTVNVIASIIGLLLLCQQMHSKMFETLRQPPPLILLLKAVKSKSRAERAWHIFACCLLQAVWIVRNLYVPVAAGLGTANLMASSDSAVDVVLNAVAVGFVFDLDDMAYETLLSPRDKQAYLAAPSPFPRYLQPTMDKLQENFHLCFINMIIDSVHMVWLYTIEAWSLYDSTNLQLMFFWSHNFSRAGLYALVSVHRTIGAFRRLHALGKPLPQTSVRLANYGLSVGIFALSALIATSLGELMRHTLGVTLAEEGSPLDACLDLYVPDASCASNNAMIVSPFAAG